MAYRALEGKLTVFGPSKEEWSEIIDGLYLSLDDLREAVSAIQFDIDDYYNTPRALRCGDIDRMKQRRADLRDEIRQVHREIELAKISRASARRGRY